MEAVESVSLSILIISQVEARGQQPLQWKLWSDRLTCLLATGEIAVYQVILFVCLFRKHMLIGFDQLLLYSVQIQNSKL